MAFGSDMYAEHRKSSGDLTLAAAVESQEREGMGLSGRVLQRVTSSPAISLCDIDGCPGCRGTRSQIGLSNAPAIPPLASTRSKSEGRLRCGDELDCQAADGCGLAIRQECDLPSPTAGAESEEELEVSKGVSEEGREGSRRLMPLEELSVRGTSGSARLARGSGQKLRQTQLEQRQWVQSRQGKGGFQEREQSLHGQGREQSLHGLPLELSESIFQRLLHDMQEATAEAHEASPHTQGREQRHGMGYMRDRELRQEVGPGNEGSNGHGGGSKEGAPRPASLQAVYGDHRREGVTMGIPHSVSLHGLPEALSDSIHSRVLADLRRQEQGRHASIQHVSLQGPHIGIKAEPILETEAHGDRGFSGKMSRGQGPREEVNAREGGQGGDGRCPGHKKGRLERFASFCKMPWRSHHGESRMDFAH